MHVQFQTIIFTRTLYKVKVLVTLMINHAVLSIRKVLTKCGKLLTGNPCLPPFHFGLQVEYVGSVPTNAREWRIISTMLCISWISYLIVYMYSYDAGTNSVTKVLDIAQHYQL